jgi:hypothetical protein
MPISLSIYGNMAIDGRDASNFRNFVDRISYFTQVMIARKVNEDFSLQVAPSFTWFNNVEAYVDENGEIQNKMNNGHFAIAFMGRYRVSPKMAILLNYDQPLTQHTTNNPHPNLAAGLELTTSSHGFQIIFGNYKRIIPQYNNMYNQNDYRDGQFVIGFNMTRLFN